MWKTAILGFVIVLVGAVFALAQVGVNPARPAPTIMKWEYDTETLDSNGNGFLNNLGLQGWELVAVTPETIVIRGRCMRHQTGARLLQAAESELKGWL